MCWRYCFHFEFLACAVTGIRVLFSYVLVTPWLLKDVAVHAPDNSACVNPKCFENEAILEQCGESFHSTVRVYVPACMLNAMYASILSNVMDR